MVKKDFSDITQKFKININGNITSGEVCRFTNFITK